MGSYRVNSLYHCRLCALSVAITFPFTLLVYFSPGVQFSRRHFKTSSTGDKNGLVVMSEQSSIDCEQSLSFPSVFLAFLGASVELLSCEPRDADADAEEEEKEKKIFSCLSPFSPRFFHNLHNFN